MLLTPVMMHPWMKFMLLMLMMSMLIIMIMMILLMTIMMITMVWPGSDRSGLGQVRVRSGSGPGPAKKKGFLAYLIAPGVPGPLKSNSASKNTPGDLSTASDRTFVIDFR